MRTREKVVAGDQVSAEGLTYGDAQVIMGAVEVTPGVLSAPGSVLTAARVMTIGLGVDLRSGEGGRRSSGGVTALVGWGGRRHSRKGVIV